MDWVTVLFALIPTILLFVQATSCLRRPQACPYVRRFGVLCGLLSGLSFVLCLLLASGSLVLSAEFSRVMVQGSLAYFSLAVLLVGSALAAGMGLQVCCWAADRRTRLLWLLGPGLIVGFLAIDQLLPLNPDDVEPFRIYAYNLWWPPLLSYLSACLVASIGWGIWLFFRSPRREQDGPPAANAGKFPEEDRPMFQPVLLLVAIAVSALSVAALVSLVSINRTLALAGFVSAWILLAEALVGGPLRRIFALLIHREFWPALRMRLTAVSAYVGSGVRALLRVNSWPAAVVKTLVGLCLLIALSELPHAGETRIQPFKVFAIPGRNELGESLSERVVNTLRLIQQELRKEIVLFLQPDAEEEMQGEISFDLVPASDSTSLGGTALGKSDDLTVGSVKIPLSLLIAPIQGPIRWLLGVHYVNGSLQAEPQQPGQQDYSLLAISTTGETWKVMGTPSPPHDARPACHRWPAHDMITSLVNEFAFKIMITDPTLAPTMTKSWEAFQPFKAGLQHWKAFEAQHDDKDLKCAITLFREAIAKDSGFAFAYYRLGLALQREGQPVKAAKAFQAGLKADTTFVPVSIALASILSDLAREGQSDGARQLWQQIIHRPAWAVSVPNRASAYYGLCRQAFKQARKKPPPNKDGGQCNVDWSPKVEREHYLAYYYCKQAVVLYASLSNARRAKPAIKTGEASVLHTLGMIVERLQRQPFIGQPPEWNCGRRELCQSPNSRSARRYYKQALALLPDDYRIRCSEARAAYVLHDPKPMDRLCADPAAHVALAHRYRKAAEKRMADGEESQKDLDMAHREYQKALDLDPTHIEALIGYALTFSKEG